MLEILYFFLQVFHGALNYFTAFGGSLFCLESLCYVFSDVRDVLSRLKCLIFWKCLGVLWSFEFDGTL